MKITFLLPGPSFGPVGGFKVVYEFANRLALRGHDVAVAHPVKPSPRLDRRQRLAARYGQARTVLTGRLRPNWHAMERTVRMLAPVDASPHRLPDADALIATAWQTAPWVADAPPAKGRKYYLLQHYETWRDGTEDVVAETWRLPLHKLVIAEWLEDIAHAMGQAERTSRISIGVDVEDFGLDVPLDARDAATVGMLWHRESYKGTADGLAALEAARQHIAGLRCLAFGVMPRPEDLPAWIEYQQAPSRPALRALYNRCSAFLQPSRSEGWGLPAAEAMLCGCALVTTDNGGSREYALHDETALVVPVGSAADMARCLTSVMLDADLRRRLAEAGRRRVEGITWERAADRLEAVLAGRADGTGGAAPGPHAGAAYGSG
jgi:glycosyltransferase involved in cell wall biosynthesis